MSAEKTKRFKRKIFDWKDDDLKYIDVSSCSVERIYNTAFDRVMEGKAYNNKISRANCTDNEALHNVVFDNNTSVDSDRYLSSLPDIGYAYHNRFQEYIIHAEEAGSQMIDNDCDQCSDKCGNSTSRIVLNNVLSNVNKLVDLLKRPNEKSEKYSAEFCRVKTKPLPILLDSLKLRETLLFCSLPVQQMNDMYCRQRKVGLSSNTRRIRHEMRKRAEERYNRTCVDDSSADESKM